MLKLIVADLNSDLLSAWSEVFQGISEVEFINADFQTLVRYPDLNAVLIRSIFAHERYGGLPKIGESQVLSSHGEIGMPPWVVTTPSFPPGIKYALGEYDHNEFSRVFESIEKFNKTNQEPKIQTLGFEIDFLYGFRKKLPYKEAEAVRTIYLKYCDKI